MDNRNHGIDIMKSLAMMMVVAHHIIMTLPNDGLGCSPVGDLFIQAFHAFCYCAVDCFVMATGFVMWEKEWRFVRIVRLWRQIVGYSVALVLFAWTCCPNVTIVTRDWLHAVLPVTFDRYWFVTQYVALFFTIPYLNKLVASLTNREHGKLLLTGLCLLSLSSVWAGKELFHTKWGYTYVWFIYLYLVGAFFARIQSAEKMPKRVFGVALTFLGVVLSVGADSLGHCLTAHFGGGGRLGEMLWSYASPTILMEAIGLLIIFGQSKFGHASIRSVVAAISSSTFIVYVVHSNSVFRDVISWKSIFQPIRDYGAPGVVFGSALGAVSLYLLIVIVDVIRKRLIGYFSLFKKGTAQK